MLCSIVSIIQSIGSNSIPATILQRIFIKQRCHLLLTSALEANPPNSSTSKHLGWGPGVGVGVGGGAAGRLRNQNNEGNLQISTISL